jgi:hypothetical protein
VSVGSSVPSRLGLLHTSGGKACVYGSEAKRRSPVRAGKPGGTMRSDNQWPNRVEVEYHPFTRMEVSMAPSLWGPSIHQDIWLVAMQGALVDMRACQRLAEASSRSKSGSCDPAGPA